MDLNDTPQQASHRQEVRAWLETNRAQAPPRSGSYEDQGYVDARRAWQGRLAEAGLAAVTWPREFGGRGLGPIEQVTVNQEMARAQVPGILDVIGIGMLGPCIIVHGTEEQKRRYLGPMLHGDEVWCQMFSEPGAGSDLAAVQTRARHGEPDQRTRARHGEGENLPVARSSVAGDRARDGRAGTWKLNGQKVWTTNAQFASFGLLLARTDPDIPKHKGLTMFIVPMDAEGITVRGLRQISGEAEFNEVFLDDVVLDDDAVLGGVGNGWGTAMTVLMYERLAIGFGSESFGSPAQLAATVAADGIAAGDSEMRQRLGRIHTDVLAVRFNGYRALSALSEGRIPGPEAGLAKVTMVNAAIAAADLAADVVGPDALQADN
ncbi:MAG: acyl-CoA dehydrogenase family protein, partial [Solirubrobacteraceae bacterium]